MRLYKLNKTGAGMCCSCRGGRVSVHAPLKNKIVGGYSLLLGQSGNGIEKVQVPKVSNEPIPNTESLQRKLGNLSRLKIGKSKYISL